MIIYLCSLATVYIVQSVQNCACKQIVCDCIENRFIVWGTIFLFVYLSYLHFFLSIYPSLNTSLCLSIYPSIICFYLSIFFISLSIYLCFYLSIFLFVYLFILIYLSSYLFIFLSSYLFIFLS